jgi:hypothetical protein
MTSVQPLDPEVADAYQAGFSDAIRAVGTAFGIEPVVDRVGPRTIRTWTERAHAVL